MEGGDCSSTDDEEGMCWSYVNQTHGLGMLVDLDLCRTLDVCLFTLLHHLLVKSVKMFFVP